MTTQLIIILALQTSEWIVVLSAIGVFITVLGFAVWVGGLNSTVKYLKNTVGKIEEKLDSLGTQFAVVKSKVDDLWNPKVISRESPKYLNEYGLKILKESKIAEVLEEYYEEILSTVKEANPQSAYQAEKVIINAVLNLQLKEECKDDLEIAAYKSGENTETILYVGALNIRDKIINYLGLNVEDINKHDPSKKK